MTLKKLVLLIVLLTVFTNCSKEEKPNEIEESEELSPPEESNDETYFTYYLTGPESAPNDIWVIIHDSEGELVDYKPRNDLGIYEFTTNKDEAPEKFTVTLLYANEVSSQAIHRIYSFPDVEKGSVWQKDFKATNYPVFNFSFSANIKNVPGVRRFNVFEPTGAIYGIDDAIINENDGSKTLVLNNVKLSDNNDYIISIYDTDGKLKYTRLTPKDKDALSIDYNDFQEFESFLHAEFPSKGDIIVYSGGYFEENPNYATRDFYSGFGLSSDSQYSDSFMVGYLDDFKKFTTNIKIDFDDYSYGYKVNGPKVSNMSILEKPNVNIINNDIHGFELSTDLNFARKSVGWLFDNRNSGENFWIYTNWIIYSNNETIASVGNLPDEILESHQYLRLNELKLRYVQLFTKSESHSEWMNNTKTVFEDRTESTVEYLAIGF